MISKSSCKSEGAEFHKGLNLLMMSLRHPNLVCLREFCCSRGRGECFLIYDFIPNGNVLKYLDLKAGDPNILEWSTLVRIIHGIPKGILYLHSNKVNKSPLIHQNISAKKVLIDHRFNPIITGSCLPKLLTNDTVFSALKASAAMGYLAPEYTNTGQFNQKSGVYAFGILAFQILSGSRKITNSMRGGLELPTFQDFIDSNIHGKFSEVEALKIAEIALHCTHDSPADRPSMDVVVLELGSCITSYPSP